jgi:hypothetical protein
MNLKAKLTISLIEKWALIACKPNGGTSTVMMTPAEMVGRAMEIAERSVEEMTALGWMEEDEG